VIQAGQNAISTVENSKKALESLAGSAVELAKAEVGSLLNETVSKIEAAVRNSPVGIAVHVAECGSQGIGTAVSDAAATGNYFLSDQEITKFHYCVHKIHPLDPGFK
jgi:hypothetical protein